MNSFNTNFKNMLLIVVKSGLQEKDCPINEMLIGKLIDIMFDDPSNSSKLLSKFKENISLIDKKLKAKGINGVSTSFSDALKSRNKSIFQNIDLFPDFIRTSYSNEINWFCNFIQNRINEKHMSHIWKYLDKIYEQSLKL